MDLRLPMKAILRDVDDLLPDVDGRIPLFGDPDEPMPYAFRFRVLPGDEGERPHRHAGFELGTVLRGAVWVSIGERPLREGAARIGTGGFIYVPPDVPHSLWSDGEALVEIHGIGPRGPGGFISEDDQGPSASG